MSKIIRCYKPQAKHEDITEVLSFQEVRRRLNGWAEVHCFGRIDIVCDEEGRIKRLPYCRHIDAVPYVGDVYVGKLTEEGLVPVDISCIEEFERRHLSPLL